MQIAGPAAAEKTQELLHTGGTLEFHRLLFINKFLPVLCCRVHETMYEI